MDTVSLEPKGKKRQRDEEVAIDSEKIPEVDELLAEESQPTKKRKKRKQKNVALEVERTEFIPNDADLRFEGTLAFDPGEIGLGWAVVSYTGDVHDYNDVKSYVVRNLGVINIADAGGTPTALVRRLIYKFNNEEPIHHYVSDKALMKVIECQEGFDFKQHKGWKFLHQMVRMGSISGMIAGALTMTGNEVRFMSKNEKWRQPLDGDPEMYSPLLPLKGIERVSQVRQMLKLQNNTRLLKKLNQLGYELRSKAMDDASAAVTMAMENTRKMVAATIGEWPPKNLKKKRPRKPRNKQAKIIN